MLSGFFMHSKVRCEFWSHSTIPNILMFFSETRDTQLEKDIHYYENYVTQQFASGIRKQGISLKN